MKQLTCEMCGSADILKEDGVFVCQSCGIKYSVEEAKKMMVEIEGTVEVSGTVKVDSTDTIENLLIRAQQFIDAQQPTKALAYYNQILDIDANHPVAKAKILELSSPYIGNVRVNREAIDEIDKMVANGLKLNAIKYVREITGLGLAEAKEWVDTYKGIDLSKPHTISPTTSTRILTNSHPTNTTTTTDSTNTTRKSNGGCYVATCVYGSYDCPQVWTLRRYRDDTLGSTWYGRLFIRTYYAISPTLVKLFGHTNWFKKMWKGKLDRMVAKLQSNGVENTPYQDKEW